MAAKKSTKRGKSITPPVKSGELAKPRKGQVENPEQAFKSFLDERAKSFYQVGEKVIPSASTVIAKGKNISRMIKAFELNDEMVEVVVRATDDDTGRYCEDWVAFRFEDYARMLLLQKIEKKAGNMKYEGRSREEINEYIRKNMKLLNGGGDDPQLMMEWIKQMLRVKVFASRLAVTKAESRAILKLLGQEFMEGIEKESEEAEIEVVNEDKREKEEEKTGKKEYKGVSEDPNEFKKFRVKVSKILKVYGFEDEEYRDALRQFAGVETTKELDRERWDEFLSFLTEYGKALKVKKLLDNPDVEVSGKAKGETKDKGEAKDEVEGNKEEENV